MARTERSEFILFSGADIDRAEDGVQKNVHTHKHTREQRT